MIETTEPRLTTLSHGGGCGCKIAPDVLAALMRDALPQGAFPNLLVGTQSADDAGVYRLNDTQALIATTDFFMPIVDEPHDFGRIAATNALSDIYAMGGRPIMALALTGMPLDKLSQASIRAILAGGAAVCQAAGIPVAGGHSIDAVEPIYGLAAMGLVHPDDIKRNNTARAGDVLILTKPLGVGILSAALKRNELSTAGYAAMLASTTQLNTVGAELAGRAEVHAMTDVTGFGLLGHTLEMCNGSGVAAKLQFSALPWLQSAPELARAGIETGASGRNWLACHDHVTLGGALPSYARTMLTDPQTSGGLLIACAPDVVAGILAQTTAAGFVRAACVGTLHAGMPHVLVE